MRLFIKLAVLAVVAVVLLVVVAGVYVAGATGLIPPLKGAFGSEGKPVSAEQVARGRAVESKITSAVEGSSAFHLELTDEELTDLLMSRIDPTKEVRDAKVNIHDHEVAFSGNLNGRIPIPFSGAVDIVLEDGFVQLEVKRVSMTALPLPGAAKTEIQSVVDDVLDVNESLRQAGATGIQQVEKDEGRITIVGLKQGNVSVSDGVKKSIQDAANRSGASGRPAPLAPGGDMVPPGTAATKSGAEVYLALGDSLAANVGVTNPNDGYVSRFHAYLERKTGRSLALTNLGVSGESSVSFKQTQLGRALQELRQRRDDGDASTGVSVVTLDLGANDLLSHLATEDCQNDPRGAACQARVTAAIATYETNFRDIVSEVAANMESGSRLYIMTIYNPFDFGIGLPFEAFSNETVERLNTIIKSAAQANNARVADAYPLMKVNAGAWTHMLEGDIHPTATGFQVLAYSLAQAEQQ
ncbi:MAG: hypothetical protein FJ319_13065 [SAR202 cluster bacterium]|nr:hypothetical protein [SAR202 cluster bacterium]